MTSGFMASSPLPASGVVCAIELSLKGQGGGLTRFNL